MSQPALAEALGIAFQQVQKYECGTNRVSASRLYQLAQALSVPITWFFDEIDDGQRRSKRKSPELLRLTSDPGVLRFVRVYHRIKDGSDRARLREMVSTLAVKK